MINFNPSICRDYKDLIRSLIFIIETKRIVDPSIDIVEIYEMIICSVRYGNVIRFENEKGVIVGIVCYTIGTEEGDFEDTHIAHIDYCLMEPSLQGTLYFLYCLQFLVQTVLSEHIGVESFKLETYEHVKVHNRLYSKFAKKRGKSKAAGDG